MGERENGDKYLGTKRRRRKKQQAGFRKRREKKVKGLKWDNGW